MKDSLRGVALAQAVARARGGEQSPEYPRWWTIDGEEWVIDDGELCYVGRRLATYRPDRHIEQAWSLDSKGWRYSAEELGTAGQIRIRATFIAPNSRKATTWVCLNAFDTNAHAHATARCLAWLLSQSEAEEGPVIEGGDPEIASLEVQCPACGDGYLHLLPEHLCGESVVCPECGTAQEVDLRLIEVP